MIYLKIDFTNNINARRRQQATNITIVKANSSDGYLNKCQSSLHGPQVGWNSNIDLESVSAIVVRRRRRKKKKKKKRKVEGEKVEGEGFRHGGGLGRLPDSASCPTVSITRRAMFT